MKESRAHRVRKLLAHRARDGYVTAAGYMGFVDGRFILFDSEGDIVENFVIAKKNVAKIVSLTEEIINKYLE